MKNQRTKCIVLKRTNYGEADRILKLLTPNGSISTIAKGVRREKSKLAGGIELFAICEVVVNEGRGELSVLTSARLIHFFGNIIKSYDRMQFAYSAINLVSKASDTVDEHEWYDILVDTLAALDAHTIDIRLIQSWFFIHHSALMGYELSLWHDIKGNKLSADYNYRYVSSERGLEIDNNGDITSEHIKLLRLISTRPLKTLAQIGGIDSVMAAILSTTQEHAAI